MPFVLYLLALAVFAQGTSEFMLAGLIPDIATDLGVSVPAAGALTSAFAVGMIVGAPSMAVLSLRWPRRRALLTFLITFMAVHVLAAVTTSFPVLVGTRIVGALANAGFLAVALAAATSMVGPNAKGRATSILIGGVTLACVAGVPAGAVLGSLWGWRSAFWAVALICIPAILAIARAIPASPNPDPTTTSSATTGDMSPGPASSGPTTADAATPCATTSGPASSGAGSFGVTTSDAATGGRMTSGPAASGPGVSGATTSAAESVVGGVGGRGLREVRVLGRSRVLVALLSAALLNGATFCTFTYLAPLVTEVTGLPAGWVPVVLALFGVGSFLGVTLSGRLADTRPGPLLLIGSALLLAGWVVFALTAGNAVVTLVFLLVQGTLSFAVGSTLIAQVLYAAADAPTLGGGFATAALNVGAAIGPWLGGVTIEAGLGYRSPLWVSAALVAVALAIVVVTRRPRLGHFVGISFRRRR
ncbi:MFS transporter [Spirillospora sp. NPDC047279]|uniref:MFS transporter n=1 Tax=Spirillospora sp. NPDC047279 TaxID=3155478 RepID=UPI00340D732A